MPVTSVHTQSNLIEMKGDHPAAEVQLTPTRHASFRSRVENRTNPDRHRPALGEPFSVTIHRPPHGLDCRQEIRRGKPMRPLVHTIALLCLIATAPEVAAQQPTAIPVGVLPAELRPITQATEFVGRVEAVERVEIRARVTGFLQEVDRKAHV